MSAINLLVAFFISFTLAGFLDRSWATGHVQSVEIQNLIYSDNRGKIYDKVMYGTVRLHFPSGINSIESNGQIWGDSIAIHGYGCQNLTNLARHTYQLHSDLKRNHKCPSWRREGTRVDTKIQAVSSLQKIGGRIVGRSEITSEGDTFMGPVQVWRHVEEFDIELDGGRCRVVKYISRRHNLSDGRITTRRPQGRATCQVIAGW